VACHVAITPPTEHPSHQQLDDRILAPSQCGGLTLAGDQALAQVPHHLTGREGRLGTPERPARYGAQSCPELIDVEGLDQIVVRASVETGDAVRDAIAGRHDDHRGGSSVLTQPAQHRKSDAGRQSEIQHQPARGPRLSGLWQDGSAGYNSALAKRALKTSS